MNHINHQEYPQNPSNNEYCEKLIEIINNKGKYGLHELSEYNKKHSFVRETKLTDVQDRLDYVSNPDRQEHLYASFDTACTDTFWDYLAGESQKAFKQSGAKGTCVEAREWIIMLPPSFREYDPDALLQLFVLKFYNEYGLHCHAGLHHNKAESNYHIHMVYSERKLLEQPEHKIATRNMFYDEHGDIRPGCKIISKGEEYDFKFFGPKEERIGSPGFTKEVKHMFTDLINDLCKDESEKLSVFDRNGPYLATKKIGKNNPMAEQIKADNEARQEWNRAVDEARASGIPEEDIVAMKKEMVSSEIEESIKANGFMPELLGKILKKAVDVLKSKIKSFKITEKKIPSFDFESYNRMVEVNRKLQKILADITVIESKVEHKIQKSDECRGIKYRKFKITLLKEIGELNVQRGEKTRELSKIVRDAGYKDVNQFMKAFEKSCRLLEEYQKVSEDKTQDDPKERESVLSKLKAYEEEAKHRPIKSKSKRKDCQEL